MTVAVLHAATRALLSHLRLHDLARLGGQGAPVVVVVDADLAQLVAHAILGHHLARQVCGLQRAAAQHCCWASSCIVSRHGQDDPQDASNIAEAICKLQRFTKPMAAKLP